MRISVFVFAMCCVLVVGCDAEREAQQPHGDAAQPDASRASRSVDASSDAAVDAGGEEDEPELGLSVRTQQHCVPPGAEVEVEIVISAREPVGEAVHADVELTLVRESSGAVMATRAVSIELPAGEAEVEMLAQFGLPVPGSYTLTATSSLGHASLRVAARDRVGVLPDVVLEYEEVTLDAAVLIEQAQGDGVITLPGPDSEIELAGELSPDEEGLGYVTLVAAEGTLLIGDNWILGHAVDANGSEVFWEPMRAYDPAAAPGAVLVYAAQDVVASTAHHHRASEPGIFAPGSLGANVYGRRDELEIAGGLGHAWTRTLPPSDPPEIPLYVYYDFDPSAPWDSPLAYMQLMRSHFERRAGVRFLLMGVRRVGDASAEERAVAQSSCMEPQCTDDETDGGRLLNRVLGLYASRFDIDRLRYAKVLMLARNYPWLSRDQPSGLAYVGGLGAWASATDGLTLVQKMVVMIQETGHMVGALHDCAATGGSRAVTNVMYSKGDYRWDLSARWGGGRGGYCWANSYSSTLDFTERTVSELRCGAHRRSGRQWAASEFCDDDRDSDCNGDNGNAGPRETPRYFNERGLSTVEETDTECLARCESELDCNDLLWCNGEEHCDIDASSATFGQCIAGEALPRCTEAIAVEDVAPASGPAGQDLALRIAARGLVAENGVASAIWLDDQPLSNAQIAAGALTVTVPAALIASAGTYTLRIHNPESYGGESTPLELSIYDVCSDQCSSAAATECAAGALRTCTEGVDGCLEWSGPIACESGFCASGTSCGECDDSCPSVDATECSAGELWTCAADANGCLAWSVPIACESGFCASETTCGECSDSCPSVDATECSAGELRTCAADANGCLTWSAPVACASGFCADAVACGSCQDACQLGATECASGEERACVADGNGCLGWDAPSTCAAGYCETATSCGTCGDGTCAGAETCSSCAQDCITGCAPAAIVDHVSAGSFHNCAVMENGSVKCWGNNTGGQLGLGNTATRGDGPGEMGNSLPTVALGSGRTAVALAAGYMQTCALLDNGSVKCWGSNDFGQLGLGDTVRRGDGPGEMGDSLPTVALGSGRTGLALARGTDHTCALLDNGSVKCWGRNHAGQLGVGDTAARGDGPGEMGDSLPTVALGTGRTAVALAAGFSHTCALLDNGSVKCWGQNSGYLGLGDTATRGDGPGEMGDTLPIVALGTGRTAVALTAGWYHACALLDNASVKCWGENSFGQLGLGDTALRGDSAGEMGDSLPAIALGSNRTATALSAGALHTCALLDNGSTKCWGSDSNGQLGLGDTEARGDGTGEMGDGLPAVALGSGRTAVALDASRGEHTCALLDNGGVKCWGRNGNAQLGTGDLASRGDGAGEMGDALPFVDL